MAQQVVAGLYEIRLGVVNAHLIVLPDQLILIDTGPPGSEAQITSVIEQNGRQLADLSHIIVTHCHADHAGSLAGLQAASSAMTIMHPADAALVRVGRALRPLHPRPGLITPLLFRLLLANAPDTITPAAVDAEVLDGYVLNLAGGMEVIHVPGHSAGQIALYWPLCGVLFAADAVMSLPRLSLSLGYEDLALGRKSAARLATRDFAHACFGHGRPIIGRASDRFRRMFVSR
jgi:glyoxylase-like metal-dependent hydrolase (beta-lactamase superfamily II)